MRSGEEVRLVQLLVHLGLNDCQIARTTGIPRPTVRGWRHGDVPRSTDGGTSCPQCGHPAHDFHTLPRDRYAYLLGLYLGDGHIARHARGVCRLSIYLDQRYPAILNECAAAMEAVLGRSAGRVQGDGCISVNTYSKSWPCLFPQHGSGRKHQREIKLADWQIAIVRDAPGWLARGLIHSDGWRGLNRVKVAGKLYIYPRYQFSNRSEDIKRIFCDACDALGVEWRRMNAMNISVAKRDSVVRLDEFVGPKA